MLTVTLGKAKVGVAEMVGVSVMVGVRVMVGVDVTVEVNVASGVGVEVGVCVSAGVGVTTCKDGMLQANADKKNNSNGRALVFIGPLVADRKYRVKSYLTFGY